VKPTSIDLDTTDKLEFYFTKLEFKMKFSKQAVAPFFFTILLCLGSVSALTLAIEPHKKECFFEYMDLDDSMSITYQVRNIKGCMSSLNSYSIGCSRRRL
jgi:hypothetical protein